MQVAAPWLQARFVPQFTAQVQRKNLLLPSDFSFIFKSAMVNSAGQISPLWGNRRHPSLCQCWSSLMSVDVESSDNDLMSDVSIEADDEEATPKLTGKEASQHTLEMRRKIEDRLERRRIKDQLGYDDISDLDF
jgi:hypothetical protein